jgi:hypothetical protein
MKKALERVRGLPSQQGRSSDCFVCSMNVGVPRKLGSNGSFISSNCLSAIAPAEYPASARMWIAAQESLFPARSGPNKVNRLVYEEP